MPELTTESIGIWVVAAIVIFHFLFQLARHRREEGERVEPRHHPSIDAKIETRVKTTEDRFSQEIHQVHGRISNLRDEIKSDLEKSANKVEAATAEMRTMFTQTVKSLSKQEGELEQINQRTHRVESKLDNHIATDKP